MPRLVDHAERRAQITDAARRVIGREGLEAATFQAVATEAGVSVRLVQYYFGNKDGLLAATHRAVVDASAARFGAGGPAPRTPPTPYDVLRGVVVALLPLDAERRADAVVLAAFHAAALTRGPAAQEALLPAPRALVDVVAEQLDRARGVVGPGERAADTTKDAELALAALAGLTQSVVARHLEPAEALAVAERLLEHLLGAPPGRSAPSS
ncbi:TetR/AcrR family transcriptional regulator [Cellulosimicrobium protaetiae]|uniref:TetR family transcriptional regulator n=1 Tax=Cellulosimicrobium protaetiae TaxID=2587808 RepID=A0A6M5UE41_9MICO|nr:TetR/AcrR family transcriptional regulator [Cellulosimicrobium protaetiae]QJW35601.1 TetR family transcriptional regulator [Cellulosimicrobium protaetiae]